MTDLSDLGEDMLARARRGTLEPEEQRALRELLAESSEARLLFDAGSVFDREAVVLPGDDLRVEKMIHAVRARDARRRPRAVLRTHWRALAVGMLVGASAVAAVSVSASLLAPARPVPVVNAPLPAESVRDSVRLPSVPEPAVASSSEARVPESVTRAVPTARQAPETARQPEPVAVKAAPAPSAASFEDLAQTKPTDARSRTAGELFAEANRLRVQQSTTKAISAYELLESQFPSSAEAMIARVSLGMLYLNANQPEQALQQFSAYRAHGRGSTLSEALWGESLALGKLQRRAEERAVLQELSTRFPDSAYAPAARKRLSEL